VTTTESGTLTADSVRTNLIALFTKARADQQRQGATYEKSIELIRSASHGNDV
jgi:hypothetical protein